MICEAAQELISALIDKELPDAERTLLEAHLNDCARCRSQLALEQALKQQIRATGDSLRAPIGLREKILSDSRIFRPRAARQWAKLISTALHLPRPAAVAALVVLAVALSVPAYYFISPWSRYVAVGALEEYDLILGNKIPLIRASSAAEMKEQLLRATGGIFEPMGYDLTEIGLRPVAGAVREIAGRKVLIAVYRGPTGSLVCYTFLGSERDAPAHAARFIDEEKTMTFFAFSHGALNAVLHREGATICILAAEMPMADLLALTKSKARRS